MGGAGKYAVGCEWFLENGNWQTVEIYYYEGEIKSDFGARRGETSLNEYKEKIVAARLKAKDVPASVLSPFEIKKENAAPPEKVSGAGIGSFIGYMVIILSMTGAMYPAIDLTAGEKERGTMETILSSPVSRLDLVLGKFLLVFSASLTTAILSVISMGSSFYFLGHSQAVASSAAKVFHINLPWVSFVPVFLIPLPL